MGVRVIPSAPRDAVRGVYGEQLKVAVNAPPEHGRANGRLTRALARWSGAGTEGVRVHTGHGSGDKMVAFSGIGETELQTRSSRLLGGGPAKEGCEHGS